MLREIKISELQFHLRNDLCKVYPVVIEDLPFYLCLKNKNKSEYDNYFNFTRKVCPENFDGHRQDYSSFVKTYESITKCGWNVESSISLWKNPKGKWGKIKKEHKASDGNYYLVEDGMHRLCILFYLYGDLTITKKAQRGRKHASYIVNTEDLV